MKNRITKLSALACALALLASVSLAQQAQSHKELPNFHKVSDTLYRGAQGQRTLACSPRCERTLTQGDAEFKVVGDDVDKKTDLSDKNNKISSGK